MVRPYPVFTTDLLLRSTDYFRETAGKTRVQGEVRGGERGYMYRGGALFTSGKMQTRGAAIEQRAEPSP